jgi:hypothetical protein
MSAHIPPPQEKEDTLYAAMQKLFDDSRVVKSAHFIAAQRKRNKSSIFGILVIVLNVLIGSGVIQEFFQPQATTIIKALAFMAASLAGIQTYFNFQKEVECHTTAGDTYSSINHRLGIVMAEYSSTPGVHHALFDNRFKPLNNEYLKANDDSKGCVPSDSDYRKARAGIKERSAGDEHKKGKRP